MGFSIIQRRRDIKKMKKLLKSVDYMIILISIVLFGIGIVALYSANGGVNGDTSEVTKQLVWFGVGIVGMIIVLLIDYDLLRKTMDSNISGNNSKFGSGIIYNANKWSFKLVSARWNKYTTRRNSKNHTNTRPSANFCNILRKRKH